MKNLTAHLGTRSGSSSLPSTQAGFSMVEVLVTLVVMSTGLLGAANLQVDALRGNQGAYLASVAALQAQDMAERMNTNPKGVGANQYIFDTSIPAVPVDCLSANCTPAQLALFDHNRWNSANQALLPSGAGKVSVNPNINGGFLICVLWHDKQLAGASGWQASETEAVTACGPPQANTNGFYLKNQPLSLS